MQLSLTLANPDEGNTTQEMFQEYGLKSPYNVGICIILLVGTHAKDRLLENLVAHGIYTYRYKQQNLNRHRNHNIYICLLYTVHKYIHNIYATIQTTHLF